MASKEYLTIGEVAKALGVSTCTIRSWSAVGLIPPPIRIGRAYQRWSRNELNQFLADLHEQAKEQTNYEHEHEHA